MEKSEDNEHEAGRGCSSSDLFSLVREHLKTLSDDERMEFFADMEDGYCRHCGRDDSGSPMGCQCWNDE